MNLYNATLEEIKSLELPDAYDVCNEKGSFKANSIIIIPAEQAVEYDRDGSEYEPGYRYMHYIFCVNGNPKYKHFWESHGLTIDNKHCDIDCLSSGLIVLHGRFTITHCMNTIMVE